MSRKHTIIGEWNNITGAFVLTYEGQTLEFPASELMALKSEAEAVAYIESRLAVFKKLIDANTKLHFPPRRRPYETRADIIKDILRNATR